MKFESHITLDTTECTEKQLNTLNEYALGVGWSTSNITDDPILGPGNKFYLTKHATERGPLEAEMESVSR